MTAVAEDHGHMPVIGVNVSSNCSLVHCLNRWESKAHGCTWGHTAVQRWGSDRCSSLGPWIFAILFYLMLLIIWLRKQKQILFKDFPSSQAMQFGSMFSTHSPTKMIVLIFIKSLGYICNCRFYVTHILYTWKLKLLSENVLSNSNSLHFFMWCLLF